VKYLIQIIVQLLDIIDLLQEVHQYLL
jgi:hypothetical protein